MLNSSAASLPAKVRTQAHPQYAPRGVCDIQPLAINDNPAVTFGGVFGRAFLHVVFVGTSREFRRLHCTGVATARTVLRDLSFISLPAVRCCVLTSHPAKLTQPSKGATSRRAP